MRQARIETEFLDYDITATGFVMSGEVYNFLFFCTGVEYTELTENEIDRIEEHCKSCLLDSIYTPELDF